MATPSTSFHRDTTADEVLAGIDLHGKTYLITGGTSGLGQETARALAARGARVVITTRSAARGEEALDALRAQVPGARVEYRLLDLASLADVRRFTDALLKDGLRLDGIVGNAGIMATDEARTQDGFESQFGSNHLGHFLLINRLLPAVNRGPETRVVMLSSGAHRLNDVDLDDPNFERKPYDRWEAYGQSKSANALFAVALDARQRAHGLRAFVVAPGIILGTNLHHHLNDDHFKVLLERQPAIVNLQHKTLQAGAATSVFALVHPDLADEGGHFLEDCAYAPLNPDPTQPNGVMPRVLDAAQAEAVWALSERLVGESFPASANGPSAAAVAGGLAGNRLPQSAAWHGRVLELTLEDGIATRLVFDAQGGCQWTRLPGFDLPPAGSAVADVVEAAPGVYFIDLLLGDGQSDQTVCLFADTRSQHALLVATRMGARSAPGETRFSQRFTTAVLGPAATQPKGPAPAPTQDLNGKRALYIYDDSTVYEHLYLNANWYAYQAIKGVRRGDAGCDEASYYKLADDVYIVTWRELLIDIAAVFVYDMQALRSTGKAWGMPGAATEILNIPAGAVIHPLTETAYPPGMAPV
jgi:NAD(P)-dependent dehydrogenase (short-subunit alcohol dehydrogenase family)